MARIRTIKPDFFRHESLFEAEKETGLPLRLAFAGLFCCADREGRFSWKPRTLKLDVLPYDDIDFSRVLDALVARGFVVRYSSGGDEFGVIPTWSKHQVINNREAASTIPQPPKLSKSNQSHIDASTTGSARVVHAPPTPLLNSQGEGKGREGKGNGISEEAKASSGGNAATGGEDRPAWWPQRDRYGRVTTEITEKLIYDVGKSVLGKNAGGMITDLRKAYPGDMRAAIDFLLQAEEKSTPKEWLAVVIRDAELDRPQPPRHEIFPMETHH